MEKKDEKGIARITHLENKELSITVTSSTSEDPIGDVVKIKSASSIFDSNDPVSFN